VSKSQVKKRDGVDQEVKGVVSSAGSQLLTIARSHLLKGCATMTSVTTDDTTSGKETHAKDSKDTKKDAGKSSGKNSGNISAHTELTATSPARVQPAIQADLPQTPVAAARIPATFRQ
jgi:hypothetical protein